MEEQQHPQILVVEDDESLATLLKQRLESDGFEVHAVSSGATALSYAVEYRPDLVILDLRLPDMHGYQVCKELRQIFHPLALPVLMLTGMDAPIDQLRGFAHGADAYLTKPYDAHELLRTVCLLLGQPAFA